MLLHKQKTYGIYFLSIINFLLNRLKNAEEKVTRLEEENQHLRGEVSKDSRNSSKPPSSDGFKKEPRTNEKNQRIKSGRESGGQKGHKGYKLKQIENPDKVILNKVDVCTHCHQDISEIKALGLEKRQVFDIPPASIYVTEYQSELKRCASCGELIKADFPEGLVQEAQYGPKIKAFLSYINQYHFIPYARSKKFIRDVFNHNISEGTINNFLKSCDQKLETSEEAIKGCLQKSERLHVDETGMRVLGKGHWQHVASTEEVTFYGIHEKRGKEAIEDMGILPDYRGNLVHDFFKTYLNYGTGHILCNAHLLRELTFIEEEEGQQWAKYMKELLLAIKKQRKCLKDQGILEFPRYRLDAYEDCYNKIIMMGIWHPDNVPKDQKRKKQTKAKNLLDRLRFHREKILVYMYDFEAPFTNNLAERDLRMSKVKQKVSGCFRSETGAKYFCRIRSYVSTARKNGIQILDALEKVFLGTPFIPQVC